MHEQSVLISSRGYTEEAYPSCGWRCTGAILEAVGVNLAGRDPSSIEREDVGDGVTVEVLVASTAGESDSDEWCAACGDFLAHGLECDCPSDEDLDPQNGPHINLRDAPSIREMWN